MKIGFIGAGNMGGAIMKGYLVGGKAAEDTVHVCCKNKEKLFYLTEDWDIEPHYTVREVVAASEIFLVGVKPDTFTEVLPEIKEEYNNKKICVSMAAGITIRAIEDVLGSDAKVIRIMPNTPAQVGEAMTSVSRNKNVTDEDMAKVLKVLNSIGKACEVDEELIHCVIGVSGSSPAYTYMYIDALAKAAEKNGMSRAQAIEFAAQSVLGAAKMVLETGEKPEILRDNVCCKGGTTIEAVHLLQEQELDKVIEKAFQAAVDRSKEMSVE